MKNSRKKIALLLAIVMVFSLIPVDLFAAGQVGPPLTHATGGAGGMGSENSGSVTFTATIPMNLLHGFSLERTTVHMGTYGHLLWVGLEGATPANLAFPENNWFATPWDVNTDFDSLPLSNRWPLTVNTRRVTGVYANQTATDDTWHPDRAFSAQFHSWTDQVGWISLGFEPALDDLTALAGSGQLQDDLEEALMDLATARSHMAIFTGSGVALQGLIDAVETALANVVGYASGLNADLTDPAEVNTDYMNALVAAIIALANATRPVPTALVGALAPLDDVEGAAQDIADAFAAFDLTDLAGNIYVLDPPDVADIILATDLEDVVNEIEAFVALAIAELTNVEDAVKNYMDLVANTQEAFALGMGAVGTLQQAVNAARAALADPLWDENPILFTTNPNDLPDIRFNIPNTASGHITIDIPVNIVRSEDAEMVIRRGSPNGPVVARGYLLDLAGGGVTIYEGPIINFEHEVTLNQITIRENVPGALTDRLASHDVAGRCNALAIRLTAPVGYTWERTFPTSNPWHGQEWFGERVRRTYRENGFPLNLDTNQPLYTSPSWFPAAPHITSPFNLLQWHCSVDGTYMVGNRQELLIIFDNLTRNPYLLAHVPAELHINNLRLAAGPLVAAAESYVNIDVQVGIVYAWGFAGFANTHPNPEWSVECAPDAPILANTPSPPPGLPPTDSNRIPVPPCAIPLPPGVTLEYIVTRPCFYFTNPGRFPTNVTEVTREAQANATDTALALNWRAIPSASTAVPVARRVNAGFNVTVYGESSTMRSGAVTSQFGINNVIHSTGITRELRITEIVPGSLALSQNRPITFTFPEGIHVVGVSYEIGGVAGNLSRDVSMPFAHATQFNAPNIVTIANNIPLSATARHLHIRFSLSVEAGFAAANDLDHIPVTIGGAGVELLTAEQRTQVVAGLYDPITLTGVEPIQISQAGFVGREQNINHTSVGDEIVFAETRAGALPLGSEIWVYVAQRYGIGWPLIISRGQTLSDPTGLGLTVTEVRGAARGDVQNVIVLTVTSVSTGDYGGTITLDGTTLFGHVYLGEAYYFVVTGPAVAANHTVVAGGHFPGTFATLPYGMYIIEEIPEVVESTPSPEPTPSPRANSIAGHTFNPAVMLNNAPEMIWYRAPGMNHQGGFVQLRAFADLVGVTEDNINWVASTRVATIAGWDWNGNWITITMTQGSPWAQISRGSAEGLRDIEVGTRVDIAEFSDGLTGPPGTVVPVFQNNRIYVPFRFVFNAFGYSIDYGLNRDGNTARVVPNP